jgi:plastocyanin
MRQKPFYEREAEAARPQLAVSAQDLAFDTQTLELSPDGAVIEFDNADSQPHNIAIYAGEDATGEVLFKGTIIDAGAKTTYEVPPIEAGENYFQCDVHPNMNGKAVVAEGESSAEHEGADEA